MLEVTIENIIVGKPQYTSYNASKTKAHRAEKTETREDSRSSRWDQRERSEQKLSETLPGAGKFVIPKIQSCRKTNGSVSVVHVKAVVAFTK